ncbi:MAG: AhpC/TSA family protein [Salibacteraceae bacterium]|nr:AhpC/TSA family protein [Salibacteraceae bacterium]
MKFNKHIFGIFLFTILAISCSNTSAEEGAVTAAAGGKEKPKMKEISIKGNIENGADKQLYLQYLKVKAADNLDTITIDKNGDYEFEFTPENQGFYRVMLNEQNLFVVVVTGQEDVVVNANAENMYSSYKVEKSEETARLLRLNRILGRRDSISMVMQTAQMNRDQALFEQVMLVYDGIIAGVDKDVKTFIDEKPNSFSSLAALQNLNPDNEYDYYLKVIQALDGTANGNEYYDALSSEVLAMRKLAPGSPAPEISLPQPNGEMLSLSDLKGQYVLIDFWASWCGPCRRENPNVKRVYEKYHDKGFEILGVSLDKAANAWTAAIAQDGLTWKHVSDLQYWNSSVVPEYQITGIPLTVLVDKEGNIIAKNLRGPALEEKLAEIFAK